MPNVNLYEKQETKTESIAQRSSSLGSLIFSIVCLIVVFGSYVGLKIFDTFTQREIESIDADIKRIKDDLSTSSEEDSLLHDTFLRLEESRKEGGKNILSILANIEEDILLGSVLSKWEYEYDQKTGQGSVKLSGDAVDFNVLLQQMRKFRSDDRFSSVRVESAGISKEGYILFSISLGIQPISAKANI